MSTRTDARPVYDLAPSHKLHHPLKQSNLSGLAVRISLPPKSTSTDIESEHCCHQTVNIFVTGTGVKLPRRWWHALQRYILQFQVELHKALTRFAPSHTSSGHRGTFRSCLPYLSTRPQSRPVVRLTFACSFQSIFSRILLWQHCINPMATLECLRHSSMPT